MSLLTTSPLLPHDTVSQVKYEKIVKFYVAIIRIANYLTKTEQNVSLPQRFKAILPVRLLKQRAASQQCC